MKVITQKSKDKTWYDESGTPIPYNRTTKAERLMERHSATLLRNAISLNTKLVTFKELIRKLSQEAYEAFMSEKGASKKSKGNFTWYNFNRSIKIEVSVNEPIIFDDMTITAAKEKLDDFLEKNITATNTFIKEMALDAFQTSRGKLDVKKVLDLTKHKKRVNKPLFDEVCDLIQEAIRRPKTKTYFRVWVKNNAGAYENIELNLSNVKS